MPVPFSSVPLRGDEYDARFARFEAEGLYLHGEADLVAGLLGEPPATVLDAGCGTGRVAIELARRGYDTVGHRRRASPCSTTARAKAPDLEWVLGDLSSAELPDDHFDLVVAAGNVMIFLELGTEAAVVSNLARTVVPGGLVVAGLPGRAPTHPGALRRARRVGGARARAPLGHVGPGALRRRRLRRLGASPGERS